MNRITVVTRMPVMVIRGEYALPSAIVRYMPPKPRAATPARTRGLADSAPDSSGPLASRMPMIAAMMPRIWTPPGTSPRIRLYESGTRTDSATRGDTIPMGPMERAA